MTPAVFDFASIARQMKDATPAVEPVERDWSLATEEEIREANPCPRCEGYGHVERYSPCLPSFDECPDCYNPLELPHP